MPSEQEKFCIYWLGQVPAPVLTTDVVRQVTGGGGGGGGGQFPGHPGIVAPDESVPGEEQLHIDSRYR